MPAAKLADRWRMRRSQPEQGSSPALMAVMAASQSMVAIWVPLLVPWWIKLLVKPSPA